MQIGGSTSFAKVSHISAAKSKKSEELALVKTSDLYIDSELFGKTPA